MDPMLIDAVEKQAEFNAKLKKAMISKGLFTQIVRARPSMDVGFARQVGKGIVESMYWSGTQYNAKTGSNYVDFSDNAYKFALWEVSEGTGGTVGSNQANANSLDVVLWTGIKVNWDIQGATLQEICQLGKVTIQYGEQGRPDRIVPLQEFIVHPSTIQYDLDTDADVEKGVYPLPQVGGFFFDRNEPMVVRPQDSRPSLTISGLSSTIAGSTPILKFQLVVRGIRVRL